jgi:hypothetical protein
MSFVLNPKASPPSEPLNFAMLFDLSRSLEPLPELLRGRGWCHLKARVLFFGVREGEGRYIERERETHLMPEWEEGCLYLMMPADLV